MNEQRDDDLNAEQAGDGIAPIFRLLGEGRLGREALDTVVAVLEADVPPAVSEAWLARAGQISWRGRPLTADPASDGACGPLRRLVAALVLDLRPWAVPVGVRGTAAPGCRLLFTVDRYDVVVQERVQPKQRTRELVGQILRDGDPVEGATILLAGASQRVETEADGDGTFWCRTLAGGSYELNIWAGEDLIVCGPVVLGDRPS